VLGLSLVRLLEDDWRDTLDAVASARGWPTSREPAKLGRSVENLSAAYNDPARARASVRDAGAARLGFSFPRDVPKGAAAVRELVATGMLRMGDSGTLRVLDIGAGLGATTWGVVRALEAAGQRGTVEATWVDADAAALDLAGAVARAREIQGRARAVGLRVRTVVRDAAGALDGLPRFDLVLAGQLLSELDVGSFEDTRTEHHAGLLSEWLSRRTEPSGALVVIEPALRDRTRALHRVRNSVATQPGVTVFAPCLHAEPCPALARESDWCHEDLPVDLPGWLVPVARAAGLRREGLTFSYLVLRRDGIRLVDRLDASSGGLRLRLVSNLIPSKGKLEAHVCGELCAARGGRAMRLDRDAGPSSAFWERATRGDVVVIEPSPVSSGKAGHSGQAGQLLRIPPGARVADASVKHGTESR
jgi:SAM-dependent methyltransferase